MVKFNVKTIIKEYPKYFVLDLLIWLLAHNIPLVLSYLIKLYFDLNQNNNLLIIVFLYTIIFLLRFPLIKLGADIDIKAQHKWANVMYERIISKCLESRKVSDSNNQIFIDIIQNDVNSIVSYISYGIDTVCNVFASIIAFIIIASINIYVAIVILVVPILIFFILNILKDKLYEKSVAIRNNETNLIKIYQDAIGEGRKIRIESLENKYFDIYNQHLKKNKSDKFKYSYFNIMINTINQCLVDLNLIAILLAVIYFRNFSVGDLALLISYSFIINDLSTYVSTFVVINNDLKVSLDSFNDKLNLNLCKDKSSFNVDKILNSISLGKVNVLIGENGSGKSRILKELASNREYCLVLKKSSVLSEDLYENIVTDSKPNRYREIVDIFSLNDLKDRKKLINDELSGGQIDRIAIARTLISGKDVILIDNNLFSIDFAIRSLIFEEFENTGKTFLFTDTKYRNEYKNFNIIYLKDCEIKCNTKVK
ncbi:ATP-binding cassette domain-containing protein [Anaerococcus porci]|uniref:ATP-binding cassette domain-containing protein n=1 Tax=Anaerococcus porci TaxID=2652269 RepID=UPI0018A6BBB2|nr:ATP-binding cassette domain-containing protein [Anaerococcus porci]